MIIAFAGILALSGCSMTVGDTALVEQSASNSLYSKGERPNVECEEVIKAFDGLKVNCIATSISTSESYPITVTINIPKEAQFLTVDVVKQ